MWTVAMESIQKPLGTIWFFSPCREQTKNFHKYPHIELQSPAFTPTCPLFVPTLSSLPPLTPPPPALLSFFHFVSCTSSVFKVQTTNAGCLSPEAVIDWLTKRGGEREKDRHRRVNQGRQRRRLESLSELEGLFLSFLKHHYWAKDTRDTQDEMTNGWRRRV